MLNEWFSKETVLTKDDFITRLLKSADKYLRPHALRILVRRKVKDLNLN